MKILEKALLIEILKGLALTLRKMLFAKPVTIQYYDKVRPVPAPGFRGRHALVRDEKTGDTLCIACLRCAKVCPSKCIHIEYEIDPQTKRRKVVKYEIEALRCIYCGYCEEVCPVNALVLTEWYEYVGFTRDDLIFDKEKLLKNWDEFIVTQKRPYMNPFWKPRGIPEKFLPAKKRQFTGV
ncbi:MAG: Formate hydrogenlyase subunit 6/NADH:ubiquinone oxidoreductase 23 kD subunit [Thermodesulfobacteria bacterium]|nr:NADH-quinone oxidoreductase subunit I [Thermodesulfobacteriota bacterium]MCU4137704.1 Formate hydrogenlyase subunit 6/NADH:ubiquinone oxidoreductase 23 kD subunit [Thermodesulfobacteriota bacterium]